MIIHNPISGSGRARRRMKAIVDELRAHGHQVDPQSSESKRTAIALARDADPSYDAVISVGGDGTHNSVINGLAGRPLPLLPVPAGTENILCKSVGIPASPRTIREILEAGRVRSFDVGMANEHAFAVMSGVGFDAAVTGEVHAKRRGPIGRHWYLWPTVKCLMLYKWPRLAVEVDGETVVRDAAFAVVGNMRVYADYLHVCANALPDDGLLDVCIYTRPGAVNLVSYFLATRFEKHLAREDVIYRQGQRIVVRPDESEALFQVDGDAVGAAPVEYTVRPGALQMCVPAAGRDGKE